MSHLMMKSPGKKLRHFVLLCVTYLEVKVEIHCRVEISCMSSVAVRIPVWEMSGRRQVLRSFGCVRRI